MRVCIVHRGIRMLTHGGWEALPRAVRAFMIGFTKKQFAGHTQTPDFSCHQHIRGEANDFSPRFPLTD